MTFNIRALLCYLHLNILELTRERCNVHITVT